MDTEIEVSVICLSYNHERYINQAIDSVLMQETNFTFEILVGNDCSTDGTKDILDSYEKRRIPNLFIFNREKNMGATRNSYDLYSRARGKYVVTLETDDYFINRHKLQMQYDFLESHPQYSGVAHDFQIVDKEGNILFESGVLYNCGTEKFFDSDVTFDDFSKYGFLFQTATKMHLNFMKFGLDYSEIFYAHPLVGDLTINSILLDRGPIYLMKETMSAYREVIDVNVTNARSLAKRNIAESCMNNARLYEKLTNFFEGRLDFSRFIINNLNVYLIGLLKRKKGFEGKNYWFCLKLCKKNIWFRAWGYLIFSWLKAKRNKGNI